MKLVHFYQKLELTTKSGSKFTIISTSKRPNNLPMGHTNNYSASNTPSTTEVTINNLTDVHANLFEKGCRANLSAGWLNADGSSKIIHQVTSGKISSVTPPVTSDTDSTLQFTIRDGQDYDSIKAIKVKKSKRVRELASQKELDQTISKFNSSVTKRRKKWIDENPHATQKETTARNNHYTQLKKNFATNARSKYNKRRKELNDKKKYQVKTVYEYLSFKKNTKASVIINTIAKKAGIKIAVMNLNVDHVYLNGYTAKQKPMVCIQQIAKDCVTDLFWPHGELYIEPIHKNRKLNLYIEPSTGLLSVPERAEDDTSNTKYQVTFLYRSITVGDVFHVKGLGWVIALSGTNAVDVGGVPTSQPTVELYAAYKKDLKKQIDSRKAADRKDKKKADDKLKTALKKKREQRAKLKKYKDKAEADTKKDEEAKKKKEAEEAAKKKAE